MASCARYSFGGMYISLEFHHPLVSNHLVAREALIFPVKSFVVEVILASMNYFIYARLLGM